MLTQTSRLRGALLVLPALFAAQAFAQAAEEANEMSAEEQAYFEEARRIWESLDPQSGTIELPGGFATLNVPEEYYYLGPGDAETVLVDVWGNPPGQNVLGMLMRKPYTPFDDDGWAVTIEYEEDGYVSDADANEIDYDDLLKDMQRQTRADSKARADAGYGTVELLGWAEPPFYSSYDKHLYWGKSLRFNGEQDVLNYDIRTLGRKGVLSMTFIAGTDQLAEINEAREEILAMAAFNDGFRYEDYNASTDKLAAYGLGALVAGGVAKKTGLLVVLLAFLKKGGVLIFVALAAMAGKIKGFFSGNKA
ncbi:MAG: DUF2167 domain-containing protein, partial [Pseudomonadota bacterium]